MGSIGYNVPVNILICDDRDSEAAKLKKMLDNSGLDLKIAMFSSGIEALDYIHSGAVVDVCFLDIIMPGVSGIGLAAELRADGYTGEIIFLSSSRDYGPETYTVKAFSYLLKPVKYEALCEILHKLENKKKEGDTAGIFIKAAKTARYVLYGDISYIEVKSHYVHFLLTNGEEIKIYTTFSGIAGQILADSRFAQCHRSFIVNMDGIEKIEEHFITMRNGGRIPYSRNYSDIKKKFTKWIVEGNK